MSFARLGSPDVEFGPCDLRNIARILLVLSELRTNGRHASDKSLCVDMLSCKSLRDEYRTDTKRKTCGLG